MKKTWLLLSSIFMLLSFVSCDTNSSVSNGNNSSTETSEEQKIEYKIEGETFKLSTIVDETLDEGVRSYSVIAPHTDTYTLKCTKSSKIVVYDEKSVLKEGTTELEVSLEEGKNYGVRVETNGTKTKFKLHSTAKENKVNLPYDVAIPEDITSISLENNDYDPLVPATINYTKREGGTYIYSNNPELIPADSVGKAFIRNYGLTGEIFFTFEHANYSGKPLYLGYQIKNEGIKDVFITVDNVGYQAGGTWFGQNAWFDYYNTSFDLPIDYLDNPDFYSNYDYAYLRYSPRIYQPTTYRLPAGQYFYVIGGTTEDAYNNISVDDSADKVLGVNKCANGNVKFTVNGGYVTGAFYAYDDVSQVITEPVQQGYRVGNYAAQYSGIANHAGVIDNYSSWIFNDLTEACDLPVSYTSYYDDNVPAKTTPYKEYNNTAHTVSNAVSWITHLNPQNDHRAVGMDMVDFTWVDGFGNEVVIDNLHADGSGAPANTANWMIEYQEHFTFINQGDNDRKITISYTDGGTLAMMVRDTKTGEVLSTGYSMGQAKLYYSLPINIKAHSAVQITMQYVLVACSYGNVTHKITLK